jgi:Sulfotransferase family
MKLPNFLGIGVEKAGTTSIYNYLKQHPQVYMSPVKETNFLERDWENVDDETKRRKKDRIDTFEKYCQLFNNVTDEIAIGEISPNYLFHHQSSSERILRYVPQAKLIAILRDPADRAYSDHLMHVRDAIGQNVRSLSEQIESRSQQSFTIRKGFYYEPLKYFFDKFGADQIRVYLYDDLCKDAIALIQDMYQFIGVDNTFVPDVTVRNQVAQVPKVNTLNTLLKRQNPVRSIAASVLRLVLPLSVRQTIRSSLINLNSQDKSKVSFSPEDRSKLIALYREDILKLQDLLQRDLSSWMNV